MLEGPPLPLPLHLPSYAYDRLLIKKIEAYPEDSYHFYVNNTTYLKMSLSWRYVFACEHKIQAILSIKGTICSSLQ